MRECVGARMEVIQRQIEEEVNRLHGTTAGWEGLRIRGEWRSTVVAV